MAKLLERQKDPTSVQHNPLVLLTDQQRAFALAFVENGGKVTDAAETAEYSDVKYGYMLAQNAHVQAGIRYIQRMKIEGEGASVAINTLIQIAKNEAQPGSTRVSASRALLEYANFKQTETDETPTKPLADMKVGELESMVVKLQAELHISQPTLAPVIEGESQAIDVTDLLADD